MASFALDLIFLEGIVGVTGEEAAALLIMFLLWRILRVINGKLVPIVVIAGAPHTHTQVTNTVKGSFEYQ